jgi:hypothetical protein
MAAGDWLGCGHGALQRARTDPVNRIGREPGNQALHSFVPGLSQWYLWKAPRQDGAQRLTLSVSNQENSTHTHLI